MDADAWDSIEREVTAELDSTNVNNTLQNCIDRDESQRRIVTATREIVAVLYLVFERLKLVKNRSFGYRLYSAIPALRQLRLEVSHARRTLIGLIRAGASQDAAVAAKRS